MSDSRNAFAAGADRAAGERRRRQGTPLVSLADAPATPAAGVSVSAGVPAATAPAAKAAAARVSAAPVTAPAAVRSARTTSAPRPHRPVPHVTPTADPYATTVDAVERPRRVRPVFDVAAALAGAATSETPTSSSASSAVPGVLAPVSAPTDLLAPSEPPAPLERPRPVRGAHTSPSVTARRSGVAGGGASLPRPTSAGPGAAGSGAAGGGRPAYPRRMSAPERAELTDSLLAAALTQQELTPDVEDLLAAVIGVLRTVAAASGLRADEVEAAVAQALAFIRRRLTGDYSVDDFGFDPDFVEHITLPLMRVLYRQWFRVEVRGIEHVPADGSALIVANHSGTIALDAQMLQVAIHDEHPAKRSLRLLGADLVFKTPVMGAIARKQGATLAANPDAERLLSSGEVVGVFPEGFKGVGKPFSERYKLQRFGRGGFVSAAVRTGAPIIPVSIIGAEETYPLLGDAKVLARLLGAPYFPITPTWPWLGPLGLLPLPSKWIMEFGEPVETASFGPAGADDPMLVFDLTDQVRETIQQTLYSLLMLRRSVFS